MGRVKETGNAFNPDDGANSTFKDNDFGIPDHNGAIKVAKYDTSATIKFINKSKDGKYIDVLVKGGKKNYPCKIHKDLLSEMLYCKEGDVGFVNFRGDGAWLVGFRKSKGR